MARHNLYLLINHLAERFDYIGLQGITDDENIGSTNFLTQIFDTSVTTINTEDRYRVFKYLVKRHYLPCVKYFHDGKGTAIDTNNVVDYAGLHLFLTGAFKSITRFRNAFSHYLALDAQGTKTGNRQPLLENNLPQVLTELFTLAPGYALERYHLSAPDFEHTGLYRLFEKENSNILTEQGFYFFINLFLEKRYAIRFLKKIKGFKNETLPPFKATIQAFTAYSVKLPDVRLYSEDRKLSLLLEVLNELQRCPKELYNCLGEEDKKHFIPAMEQQAIDNMLENTNYPGIEDAAIDSYVSEIVSLRRDGSKYPYYFLRFIDEYNLLPGIRFHISIGKLEVDSYPKPVAGVQVTRRLVKNINAFGKLSAFENNEVEILKRLNGEQHHYLFEQYAPHYHVEGNKIGFYVLKPGEQDKLPVAEQPETNSATGFISLDALPKLVLLVCLVDKKPQSILHDFLELNEEKILNIDYLNEVKGKINLEPEYFSRRLPNEKVLRNKNQVAVLNKKTEQKLLKDYNITLEELCTADVWELVKTKGKKRLPPSDKELLTQLKYRELLLQRKAILATALPKGMEIEYLPTEVVNYVLNIKNVHDKKRIHTKLKTIRKETDRLIKKLEKEVAKPKEEQNIKLGELADFLARDMIDMVVSVHVKQKITSVYYSKLQLSIAYLSIEKESLLAILNELQLFKKPAGHVFLSHEIIRKSTGVIDLYFKYFEEKKRWLEKTLFKRGREGGYYLPARNIPYTYEKLRNTDTDFNAWLANKKTMPVHIPNTWFDTYITTLFHGIRKNEGNHFIINKTDKYSVLLEKWMQHDCQPFYLFNRLYKIDRKDSEKESVSVNSMDSGEIKKQYGRYAEANEKAIRFYKTKDRILKLIAGYILEKDAAYKLSKSITLADIMPGKETNLLNSPFEFSQTIEFKEDLQGRKTHSKQKPEERSITLVAKDTPTQRQQVAEYNSLPITEKGLFNGQKGYEWTLKDFGRFKRFVKDKRIPNLSEYFDYSSISLNMINYQLFEYDRSREAVFEQVFLLEEYIANKDLAGITALEMANRRELLDAGNQKTFPEVPFEIYAKWLMVNRGLQETEVKRLSLIRNKFSHSQFPFYDTLWPKISKEDEEVFENARWETGSLAILNLSICKRVEEFCNQLNDSIIQNATANTQSF